MPDRVDLFSFSCAVACASEDIVFDADVLPEKQLVLFCPNLGVLSTFKMQHVNAPHLMQVCC